MGTGSVLIVSWLIAAGGEYNEYMGLGKNASYRSLGGRACLLNEPIRGTNVNNTTHQQSPVSSSKSIAVFGAGPGLGQAIARRYARDGYTIVLVARRSEPLDLLAKDLISDGATVHVITADLSHTNATPRLVGQIRAKVGNLDAFYYAPTPSGGFIPAANMTPQHAQDFMPLSLYTLLALVQEFLPHMLQQGDGAILTAQGASSVHGLPHMSGPGPAQAAQRNYLQSLHAEVAPKGVYVGMLYVGVAIENSAFHTEMEKAKAAGEPVWEMPTVDPSHLADLLWTMHITKGQAEATYPEVLFSH
jgi:short-subunit dehydrogenase